MKYKNIYVAASSQHVGKTTCTLGLVSCLMKNGINVGYCKPVGQKFLDFKNLFVDKDTILFSDLINFDIEPAHHSPIVLPGNVVRDYIEKPQSDELCAQILAARYELNRKHDVTIFEGTGHPGVGSVAGISNARVAKILNAGVIMIIEGGIGSTIDMFNMCTALFREQDVPIIGVIINKVMADKVDQVRQYVGTWLERQQIPLLGLIPYDQTLAYPLMTSVVDSIKGQVEMNEDSLDNRVEHMMAGSMVDLKELKTFQNLLLIASNRTIDRAIKKVMAFAALRNVKDCPLSGVILTGDGKLTEIAKNYLDENKVPFIRTKFDTFGAMLKISRIEVKINRHNPYKISRAIELIETNVRLDNLLIPL